MKPYEILKQLREDKEPKINQTELGKILNMSQRKISRIETGEAEPSLDDLKALCIYYNISADYIIGLKSPLPFPGKGKHSLEEITRIQCGKK